MSSIFHFIAGSNVHLKNIKYAKKIKKDLSNIYDSVKNQKQIIKRMRKFCNKWQYLEPNIIKYINKHFA